MATKEGRAAKAARQLAENLSQEFFGPDGPTLDCDIDAIEDAAVLAAKAAFDAVIAHALQLQNQKLPGDRDPKIAEGIACFETCSNIGWLQWG